MDKYINISDDVVIMEYVNGYNLERVYIGGYNPETDEEDIEGSIECIISVYETDSITGHEGINALSEMLINMGYDAERGAEVVYNSYIHKCDYISITDTDSAATSEHITDSIKEYLLTV